MYCAPGEHEWAPSSKWGARYWCTNCSCIGYVPSMASGNHNIYSTDHEIRPYCCSVKGCNNPATHKSSKGQSGVKSTRSAAWYCWSHSPQEKKSPHDVFCPECGVRPTQLCRKKGQPTKSPHTVRRTFAANFYQYDIELIPPEGFALETPPEEPQQELSEWQQYQRDAVETTECPVSGCVAPPGEPCTDIDEDGSDYCHAIRMRARFGGGVCRALKDPQYRKYWEQTHGALKRNVKPNVRSTAPRSSKLRTKQKREGVTK